MPLPAVRIQVTVRRYDTRRMNVVVQASRGGTVQSASLTAG